MGVWLLDSNWNSTALGNVANDIRITSGNSMTFENPDSMGEYDGNGGTANNTIVQYGGRMEVANGCTANYTKIYNGGFAGNFASIDYNYESYMNSTTVYSGGIFQLNQNLVASHTEIKNGGSMFIVGGESYDTIVSSGGTMQINGYGGIYYGDISIAENVE